ncbi:uncharacterized protein LOC129898924 [Solanum dulcamara]|uniref:uncharacterized protein LOC129898924 n=1 Tax=Solanum dulcamara TaxID=45834 RepID=UPI002486104A|nr:uncharacterized protein LOC129898924 [Solanum dulcamara]
MGRKLGALLKIDTCTSSTLRKRYARICIQVPMGLPVKRNILIENHLQDIVYEGDGTLYTGCGRLGHTTKSRTHPTTNIHTPSQSPNLNTESSGKNASTESWQTVSFPRRNKSQGVEITSTNKPDINKEKPPHNHSGKNLQCYNRGVDNGGLPIGWPNSQRIQRAIQRSYFSSLSKSSVDENEEPDERPPFRSSHEASEESEQEPSTGKREGKATNPQMKDNSMNFLIWNARGANNAAFRR